MDCCAYCAVKRLEAAIQRVRELHKPDDYDITTWKYHPPSPACSHCEEHYPCQTIEALDGE